MNAPGIHSRPPTPRWRCSQRDTPWSASFSSVETSANRGRCRRRECRQPILASAYQFRPPRHTNTRHGGKTQRSRRVAHVCTLIMGSGGSKGKRKKRKKKKGHDAGASPVCQYRTVHSQTARCPAAVVFRFLPLLSLTVAIALHVRRRRATGSSPAPRKRTRSKTSSRTFRGRRIFPRRSSTAYTGGSQKSGRRRRTTAASPCRNS